MATHITIPMARLIELETAEHERTGADRPPGEAR
jgi:hypothetical protein